MTEPNKEKIERRYRREIRYNLGKPKPGTDGKGGELKYIERDCDREIEGWWNRNPKGTLLVTGYRGVGKTRSVKSFLPSSNPKKTKEKVAHWINLTKIPTLKGLTAEVIRNIVESEKDRIKVSTPLWRETPKVSPKYDVHTIAGICCCIILSFLLLAILTGNEFQICKFGFTCDRTVFILLSVTTLLSFLYLCRQLRLYERLFYKYRSGKIYGSEGKMIENSPYTLFSNLLESINHFYDHFDCRTETETGTDFETGLPIGKMLGKTSKKKTVEPLGTTEALILLREIIDRYSEWKGEGVRIAFVFDEIDKLKGFRSETVQQEEEKFHDFEELIGKLKPLLAEANANFIFIAGRESFYRWEMDNSRGDSVYSSVFDHIIEIPPFLSERGRKTSTEISDTCSSSYSREKEASKEIEKIMWGYLESRYDVKEKDAVEEKSIMRSFYRYLLWKSRGIPRRIIQEVESFIVTDKGEKGDCLIFRSDNIQRLKFYSALVKGIYGVADREELDSDGILNLIVLTESLFKFHRVGFNPADLRLLTMGVDQELLLKNDYYYDLAVELLDGWRVERNYGRRVRYTFFPTVRASIEILSRNFEEEAVSFKFEERDFKVFLEDSRRMDERVEGQDPQQRIDSLRIQVGLGKVYMLMGDYHNSIEYYIKVIRLGNNYLNMTMRDTVLIGTRRLIARLVAESMLEIGYMLERKKRLREAFTYYSSGYQTAWISDENHKKSIAKMQSSEDNDKQPSANDGKKKIDHFDEAIESFYTIAEEAVDALTHMAFIQWKLGKLESAQSLFEKALEISKERKHIPYKIASQTLLLGLFFFRGMDLKRAKEEFRRIGFDFNRKKDKRYELIVSECYETESYTKVPYMSRDGGNDTACEALFPNYLVESSFEALGFTFLSMASIEGSDSKRLAYLKEANKQFGMVTRRADIYSDFRRILDVKFFQLRAYRFILNDVHELTDECHTALLLEINELLKRASHKANKTVVSKWMEADFYCIIAWHLLSWVRHNITDDKQQMKAKNNEFKRFIDKITPILEDIDNVIVDATTQVAAIGTADITAHSATSTNKGLTISQFALNTTQVKSMETTDSAALGSSKTGTKVYSDTCPELKKDYEITVELYPTENLWKFVEKIMLFYFIRLQAHTFLPYSFDSAEPVGAFYYKRFGDAVNRDEEDLAKAEKYFRYSLDDQKTYSQYFPEYRNVEVSCCIHLGDIYTYKYCTKDQKASDFYEAQRFYARALSSIATELENCFGRMPSRDNYYFKEGNLLPRKEMFDIANNRMWLGKKARENGNGNIFGNPSDVHQKAQELREFAARHFSSHTNKDEQKKILKESFKEIGKWRHDTPLEILRNGLTDPFYGV